MATWRATGAGGATSGTGNRATAYSPAVGDLLVVFVALSTNTNATPTMTDNQGGTYALIGHALWLSSANSLVCFVREQIVTTTTAHTITAATGSNEAGQIIIQSISGMFRTGLSAVRSFGKQENQATATTPAPALNQAAQTNNLTLVAVASGDTTTTPPVGWTERFDTSQSTPTTALEVATRNSGFTGTTITFGATQSTDFASMAVELDGSAEDIPAAAIGSATITNPTITIGGLTRTPSSATASATITDPTYENVDNGQESSPAAAVGVATASAPSLTIGGVTETPAAATGAATASNPTRTIGGVSTTPSAAVAASSASDPDLTIGGVSRTPSASSAAASVTDPDTSNGFTATPSAASASATASDPSLTLGSVTATPASASAAATATAVVGALIEPGRIVLEDSGELVDRVSSPGSLAASSHPGTIATTAGGVGSLTTNVVV